MKKQIIPVLGSIILCIIVLLDLLYAPVILPLIEQSNILDEKRLYQAEVGDIIRFGVYEQDNDLTNGKEPIEWEVLERDGDNILVISRYVLDAKAYNDEVNAEVTWETCSVRQWLNESFLLEAFNEKQQEMLLSTKVEAHANPFWSDKSQNVDTGNDTNDKVFMLSVWECVIYFGDVHHQVKERQIFATEYAIAQGVDPDPNSRGDYLMDGEEPLDTEYGICSWWLRTQGRDLKTTAYVLHDGKIASLGSLNYSRNIGIRPVVWINTGR